MKISVVHVAICSFIMAWGGLTQADDWPCYGRDATRNAVSPEKHPPLDWDVQSGRNVKWSAGLGGNTIGCPVVAGGLVWVCTNNDSRRPRDPAFTKDASCLLCFDERTGAFLYQHLTPRVGNRVNDWPFSSAASPPLVEGERLWFLSNRWEVVCLDIGPLLRRAGVPRELWKLDLQRDLGVFGRSPAMSLNIRCAIGPSFEGRLYVITGNGVDENFVKVANPDAPSLVCLDKDTGRVLWQDNSPGENILEEQVSSPLVAEIGGRAQCIAPQGDGWIRSFDARSGKLLWSFDANPKNSAYPQTRSPVMAPPVLYDGRVYVATGQSVEHGEGPGVLWCIDPTRDGDVSAELDDGPAPDPREHPRRPAVGGPRKGKPNPNSAAVWKFDRFDSNGDGKIRAAERMNRTAGSVVAADGLVVAADFSGFVRCLDAATGRPLWAHDLEAACPATPLVCDGRVYVADEDGEVAILALAREKKLLAEHQHGNSIYSAPVFANGVLYVTTRDTLYAIAGGAGAAAPPAPDAPGKRLPGRRDAIFVPTPQDVVEKMLELAAVTKDDVVYDLGCGDGRVVVTAARKYGCRAAGFDVDPECLRRSNENVATHKVAALVDIANKDLFTVDLAPATVVTLYLGRDVNRRLVPQLRQLKPGARIVSHNFQIEGFPPDKTVEFKSAEDDTGHTLYLWTAPLREKR